MFDKIMQMFRKFTQEMKPHSPNSAINNHNPYNDMGGPRDTHKLQFRVYSAKQQDIQGNIFVEQVTYVPNFDKYLAPGRETDKL